MKLEPVKMSALPGGSNLLQSAFWAQMKESFGWVPFPFLLNGQPLLILNRSLFRQYSIAYIPHGPEISGEEQNEFYLADIGRNLKRHLPAGCFLIRFDPPFSIPPDSVFSSGKSGLVKALSDIQPPDTVLISLKESEQEILSRMKTKTRYNIRLASRKGVTVKQSGPENLDEWYKLYEETARRDRITIHSRAYYQKLFELSERKPGDPKKPEIVLLKAVFDNRMLAGIIVAVLGRKATYLYGASSSEHRNLMPSYALQWEAIKYAKARGCYDYDLFGIPPAEDPSHPMIGLYRFKTGFGGDIVHRAGCWDLPLKPLVYHFYSFAESVRLFYYKKLRKRK